MLSVENFLKIIRDNLKTLNSELYRFSKYGNLYAIYRSIALVLADREFKFDSILDLIYINTSTGIDLDVKAEDFGIYRIKGKRSSGYCWGFNNLSEKRILPEGTILSSPSSGLSFSTQTKVILIPKVEIKIPIKAEAPGYIYNLEANNYLYSRLFPDLKFIVGEFNNAGTKTGDLTGGSNLEPDIELRSRILSLIKGFEYGTYSSLYNRLLQYPKVGQFFIYNNSPTVGCVTIFIKSSDLYIKNELVNYVKDYIPLGVYLDIKPLVYSYVDFRLSIKFSSSSIIDKESTLIKSKINQFFSNLKINDSFKVLDLERKLLSPNILNLKIEEPLSSATPLSNTLLAVRSIYINTNF